MSEVDEELLFAYSVDEEVSATTVVGLDEVQDLNETGFLESSSITWVGKSYAGLQNVLSIIILSI